MLSNAVSKLLYGILGGMFLLSVVIAGILQLIPFNLEHRSSFVTVSLFFAILTAGGFIWVLLFDALWDLP